MRIMNNWFTNIPIQKMGKMVETLETLETSLEKHEIIDSEFKLIFDKVISQIKENTNYELKIKNNFKNVLDELTDTIYTYDKYGNKPFTFFIIIDSNKIENKNSMSYNFWVNVSIFICGYYFFKLTRS